MSPRCARRVQFCFEVGDVFFQASTDLRFGVPLSAHGFQVRQDDSNLVLKLVMFLPQFLAFSLPLHGPVPPGCCKLAEVADVQRIRVGWIHALTVPLNPASLNAFTIASTMVRGAGTRFGSFHRFW